MPFAIRKVGNRWEIIRADTKEHIGYASTKQKAAISKAIRERAAKDKGEQLSEGTMEIDGKKYELVPEDLAEEQSGGSAAAYGLKKRDGKMWVPVGFLKKLKKEFEEVKEELAETKLSEEKPDMKNMSKFVNDIAHKTLADEPIDKKVSVKDFEKIVKAGFLDSATEDDLDDEVQAEIKKKGGLE